MMNINLKECIKEFSKEFNFCRVISKKIDKFCIEKSDLDSISFDSKSDKLSIKYTKENHIFRLLFEISNKTFDSDFEIKIENNIKDLSVMVDVARNNVLKVETFKQFIRYIALFGYDTLKIYLEDLFEITDEPYFGHFRGRYTKKELSEIRDYAALFGIKIVPCIQTLAHLNALTRWCVYRPHFDIEDILLVDDPRVYELIEKMISTMKEVFNCETINIGMDEAHHLGRGQYFDIHGYAPRFELIKKHLNKVLSIAKKYNLKVEMWSDMFINNLYDNSKDKIVNKFDDIDKNLKLIYWDYNYRNVEEYINNIKLHKQITNNLSLASGAWKWLGYIPNNYYAIEHNKEFFKAMKEENVSELTLTCWSDNGGETSIFASLPTIYYLANLKYHGFNLNKNLFEVVTDISFDNFIKIDYVNKTTENLTVNNLNCSNRYFLYNDILLGIVDSCIKDSQVEIYSSVLKDLKKVGENSKFEYIFTNAINLTKVLKTKVKIALKLRKAYQLKDIKTLKECSKDLKKLSKELDRFYDSFYFQWHKESKGNGFDVQDIRLGALMQRIIASLKKIEDFLDGKIDKIDELEEEALDFYGNDKDFYKPDDLVDPFYVRMSSVNVNV